MEKALYITQCIVKTYDRSLQRRCIIYSPPDEPTTDGIVNGVTFDRLVTQLDEQLKSKKFNVGYLNRQERKI